MALRVRAVILGSATVLALASGGISLAWAQAGGEQTVKERSDLMRSMNDGNKVLATAAKGGAIDAATIKAAEDINASAKKLLALFPAGSGDDKLKTRAKAAIWQEWSKFEGFDKDLDSSSAEIVTAAKAGDQAAVAAGFAKMNQVCSACHKEFRGPALK